MTPQGPPPPAFSGDRAAHADLGRAAPADLGHAIRAELHAATSAAVDRLDTANRRIVRYHLGLADADGRPATADGGKAIRGTLAVLSARAAGAPDRVGVSGAVGCELVHHFSLLHDDIIDRDSTRRHRPTVWTVFGASAAILAGDAIFALATEVLLEPPASAQSAAAARLLASASRRMVAGQTADLAFETLPTVDLAACRQMVADKTGALMACASAVGAILAGAPEETVAALAAFGEHLGMAYQLVDDLLGIWGAPERTGKPAASDLASRKKSLPVVAALAAGGADADRLAALYAQQGELSIPDLAKAAAAVEGAGGRAWALAEAERETAAAVAALDPVPIDDGARRDLHALAGALTGRDR